ncbi:MAG TPA: hypothetical protein PKN34_02920 [Azospira sp.]|nr:hypothetical protein [Azospira sp.]
MSITSHVARLVGWSPLEKSVQLKIDESSISSLCGLTLFATIASVDASGVATLKLHHPIDRDGKEVFSVAAYPRHKGYDVYHVALGAIAVDLVFQQPDEADKITDNQTAGTPNRFALAQMSSIQE